MTRIARLLLPLLALAGCGRPADDTGTSAPSPANAPTAAASAAPTMPVPPVAAPSPPLTEAAVIPRAPGKPLSCAADIGGAAAARRAAICRNVSPATHPPCNAANSCAMINDEIARSCALFAGHGAPMAGCTPAPDSMQAAAAVIERYYSALNAGDYDTAWRQWGDNGAPGQTRAAFDAGFAHTRSTAVTIGRLEPGSGGAGSIYQPVPVTIDATLDDGTHQRFTGSYTVRRVNNVDGASAAQLRWHIGSAQLKRVPTH
ncbi:MAG: hypothetical protein B7Y45_01685 [Sphingomonas sp. 28-66-16]|nr:MAG: hypothetical protein B7Y45_01685 [Sphingomonas sp. 28-66-16]